ncbi:MAG TPA: flavodoxin [Candidatus Hungatella pullicola]|nr:flavodoxin [Candidatus Hungatella pullicola]
MKIGVIYWTGTGNTEMMANAVAQGAKEAGAEVDVMQVSDAAADGALTYDAIALGCPAMGAEQLEESEFEPFFTELEGNLKDKKVALFGSHEWSEEGQWMDDWTERTKAAGAVICQGAGLKVYSTPDEEGLEKCRDLGKALAEM